MKEEDIECPNFIAKECGNCANGQAPPEDYRGRADIHVCLLDGDYCNEHDCCQDWQSKKEEE